MPSGPALGWPEQSITRSAPKPPTMSRTRLMRASGVLTSSIFDRRFGAELARELQPRRLRRADADHPPRAHLLRGGDRQNSDRAGALDHDGVAPGETARPGGAVEGADA